MDIERFRLPTRRGGTTYETRFWSKVSRGPECWEWQGSLTPAGYGQFWVERELIHAHRAGWVLQRGPIPDGLCVLHHCDNRRCVRGDHLFVGSKGDNARDMAAKGRATFQVSPEKTQGERHRHKVTEDDVREMRRLHATGAGSYRQIAKQFGISMMQVRVIVKRRYGGWQHVV
jgi:hypothetical protein